MVVYYRLVRRGGVQVVVMMIIQGISRLHPLHRRISVILSPPSNKSYGWSNHRVLFRWRSTNIILRSIYEKYPMVEWRFRAAV
jgi:hypothetical protein